MQLGISLQKTIITLVKKLIFCVEANTVKSITLLNSFTLLLFNFGDDNCSNKHKFKSLSRLGNQKYLRNQTVYLPTQVLNVSVQLVSEKEKPPWMIFK